MAEYTKRIISYIFWPFVFLGGVIWFLVGKNQRLSGEIQRERAQRELDKVVDRLEVAGKEADDQESNYLRSRSDFLDAMRDYRAGGTEVRRGADEVREGGTGVQQDPGSKE